jgi:hypothetical protein
MNRLLNDDSGQAPLVTLIERRPWFITCKDGAQTSICCNGDSSLGWMTICEANNGMAAMGSSEPVEKDNDRWGFLPRVV